MAVESRFGPHLSQLRTPKVAVLNQMGVLIGVGRSGLSRGVGGWAGGIEADPPYHSVEFLAH